ncbi:WD40 repeat-like protein [Trichodelitschia bisporula]|uniref:WD40 repeat-like protein n=1 Tax=Trichodelitschia bisporula TaxID=703511 RepID=A0A6G1HU87_9PEZI|nr:WD40 repeat-like protein [Trichodelitschia bisporula]
MPYSGDRTIVTASRDSQIRVFDIERAPVFEGSQTRITSGPSNTKVYRSHNRAAKRIVTEASPFYFLSCSEDGEVRQWDIRQPESAYPQSSSSYLYRQPGHRDAAPPPLISYKDYHIDLYTISCSASQPHYIALGGTHLHCFLHDRRMLGRDKLHERGGLLPAGAVSDDKTLGAATRCVRKLAPHGQSKMGRMQAQQITACKISDANPNELIVSWSGDFIYNFDIIREGEPKEVPKPATRNGRVKKQVDLKRKKTGRSRDVSREGDARADSRQRTEGTELWSVELRTNDGRRYEIPGVRVTAPASSGSLGPPPPDSPPDNRILGAVQELLDTIFESSATTRGHYRNQLTHVLILAGKAFEEVDPSVVNWVYPLTESTSEIAFQQKQRHDRSKVWRFVQACGVIARAGSARITARVPERSLEYFDIIRPAPRESSLPLDRHEHFTYDFIKAILLWVDSGAGAVLREFTLGDTAEMSYSRRRPISTDAGIDAIDTELIPYLLNLARDHEVVKNPHHDMGEERQVLFRTEKDAVRAFAAVLKVPFTDLTGDEADEAGGEVTRSQERETVRKFWVYDVCRAILHNAALDIHRSMIDIAFGDHRRVTQPESPPVPDAPGSYEGADHAHDTEDEEEDDDDADYGSDDDDYTDIYDGMASFFNERPRVKSKTAAEKNVPCTTHTRTYRGHCNIETTKDVNFFGLQDEYVVSGSDCGNFFIWDRKTSRLLNILEGDQEVVNVVQGHPYEPMLAVSGIDHTIKIFSPDARDRQNAALGKGMTHFDYSTFSSISSIDLRGTRLYHRSPRHVERGWSEYGEASMSADDESDSDDPTVVTSSNGLASRKRLQDEYAIISENDMERRSRAREGHDANHITRGMLALLASRFRAQMSDMGMEIGEDGEEPPEDHCALM